MDNAGRLRRASPGEHWATLRFVAAVAGVVLLEIAGDDGAGQGLLVRLVLALVT